MQADLTHHASPGFWKCYDGLPPEVRALADANFVLLKRDPRYPSLHLKQIGRFWSVRVGLRHRALGVSASDGIVWFWIGNHKDYDRMLSGK